MTDLNRKLLSDLAHLAARYQPRDWEQLAACLESEARREQVRNVLLELASVSRASRKRTRRRPRQPGPAARVRDRLESIRVDDADRADLLEGVWVKLRERELLPTIAT